MCATQCDPHASNAPWTLNPKPQTLCPRCPDKTRALKQKHLQLCFILFIEIDLFFGGWSGDQHERRRKRRRRRDHTKKKNYPFSDGVGTVDLVPHSSIRLLCQYCVIWTAIAFFRSDGNQPLACGMAWLASPTTSSKQREQRVIPPFLSLGQHAPLSPTSSMVEVRISSRSSPIVTPSANFLEGLGATRDERTEQLRALDDQLPPGQNEDLETWRQWPLMVTQVWPPASVLERRGF